jgi:hypothetical protein
MFAGIRNDAIHAADIAVNPHKTSRQNPAIKKRTQLAVGSWQLAVKDAIFQAQQKNTEIRLCLCLLLTAYCLLPTPFPYQKLPMHRGPFISLHFSRSEAALELTGSESD